MKRKVYVTVTAMTVVDVETEETEQETVAALGLKKVRTALRRDGYFPHLISADVCDEPPRKQYSYGEAQAVWRAESESEADWLMEAMSS